MEKASPCIGCVDKNCDKAMIKNQVRICRKCELDGRVVLESWSGPARWRFVCNKCDHIIYGLKDAVSVKVIESKNCKQCSAWLVHAQFKESELIGCIFCDKSMLGYLSEKSLAPVSHHNPYSNQYNNNNNRFNNRPGRGQSNGKVFNRGPPMSNQSSRLDDDDDIRNEPNDFIQNRPSRGRGGMGASRGRGGSSRGRGGSSRGRGRGRGGGRGGSSRGRGGGFSRGGRDTYQSDPNEQFKQLSYADFIQF